MHEFILTLTPEDFSLCEKNGTPKALTMAKLGKLFLDFGPHAPTVAFPEQFGLMIEPTESYTMAELDRFCETVEAVLDLMRTNPTVLTTAPHFTPISKIDDVEANRNPILWERLLKLPSPSQSGRDPRDLMRMPVEQLKRDILKAHQESQKRV
jgi:glycine dehydrogenase